MTIEFVVTLASAALGVVSLMYAIVQGRRARDVRARAEADLWLAIRTVRSIIGKLEETDARAKDPMVAQVYGKATELFRQLLKEAILVEKNFNELTISKWKAAGKLASSWQVAQARHYLPTGDINLYVKEDESVETQKFDTKR